METIRSHATLRPGTTLKQLGIERLTAEQPNSLLESILSAVRKIEDQSLHPVASVSAGVAFAPKSLLALMTYCYATGIYGSEAIEDVMRKDLTFRRLCNEEFPAARQVRRFRQHNPEAVRDCLQSALLFLTQDRASEGQPISADHEQLREEASRRITAAMFIDRMDLDEM
jgi:hypothetical protein